jgi:hypothetical protein
MNSDVGDINLLEKNDIDVFSLYTGSKDEYLQNYEALGKLKEECDSLIAKAAISIGVSSMALLAPIPLLVTLPVFLLGGISAEYLIRVGRLYEITKLLLEAFGNEGVKITPRVKTDEGIIDLLVKMPSKQAFALTLRSKGDAKVKWREDRQDFFVSRKGKKGKNPTSKWSDIVKESQKSDLILRTLKKQKNPLLGSSTNERNKTVIKAFVLMGETRLDVNNDKSLFVDYRESRVLRVHTGVVTYVLEQKDLINFLQLPE